MGDTFDTISRYVRQGGSDIKTGSGEPAAGAPSYLNDTYQPENTPGGNFVNSSLAPPPGGYGGSSGAPASPGSSSSFDLFSPNFSFGNVVSSDAGGDGQAPNISDAASSLPNYSGGSFAPSGGGSPTGGLTSFTPDQGINLGAGSFPDLTSTASQAGDDFSSRYGAANDAVSSGAFDPQGANYNPSGFGGPALPPSFSPDNLGGSPPNGGATPPITQLASAASPGLQAGGPATDGSIVNQPTLTNPQAGVAPAAPQAAPSVAPPAPPAPSLASSGGDSALERISKGALDSIAKNPLGIVAAGAGLGTALLRGNQQPEGLDQLRSAASSLQSTGSVLQSYLQTGKLPAGMQASVDAATSAARANIIARHAQRGLSTDPTKNSALAAELAQAQQSAIITAATLGDKLMTQGLSATQISSQLYNTIMNTDIERSKATGNAIASFAAALGGGGNLIKSTAKA